MPASALAALVRRDYRVSRSYRLAIVLDLLFGLINLLVYFFISRTFEGIDTDRLAGAPSYFAFAAVGVALSLVLQTATARLALRLREEQLTGALEFLVAQPIRPAELAFGLAGFAFVFAIARAFFYLLIATYVLSADIPDADWVGLLVVMLAAALAMSSIGIVLAAAVLVIRRAEALTVLATSALNFLGGAFFPIAVLPPALETIARVLPTTLAFDGVRAALFRGEGWGGDALGLLAFAVVALPISLAVFRRALDSARARGSLSTP